jgi:hypothetical protein
MKKIHAGSGKPQGVRHGPPRPRIYANHGGTNLPQGKVREPSSRPAVNAGGTFGMGVLAGKKRK